MPARTSAEAAQEFAQRALSLTPVVILGSGASVSHGVPGMSALATHLVGSSTPAEWGDEEILQWRAFLSLLGRGSDLESALQAIRPTDRQTHFVASATREFLLPHDLAVLDAVVADRDYLPLSRLLRYLFDSTHKVVAVITPNYDRLAEYAADAADLSTFVGFGYGHIQSRAREPNTRITVGGRETRTVAIWKVHGSLDWFQSAVHQITRLPGARHVPRGHVPLMITPGIEKYRLTHAEPFRTILSCSDSAIDNARAFLCVGYGFNDEHVQAKLIERCNSDSIPLVVITKQLTAAAKSFLGSGRCRSYLAIEESAGGGRAYTPDVPDGFDLPKPLWQLKDFLDHMIGGAP